MYGQNTLDVMPNFSNYDLWDGYMGQLWQGVLGLAGLLPDSTVMEIAPGATSKVAHALSNMEFTGTLYLVEPHAEVGPVILEKSTRLLPKAKVVLLAEDFQRVQAPESIDAIVANHPFDDFISAYATPDAAKQNILFQDISQESGAVLDILRETWQGLEKTPQRLADTQQHIREDWQNLLERHQPKTVVVSQYASSYFEKHHLPMINTHAKRLFNQVCEDAQKRCHQAPLQLVLNQNENYGNTWIGTELLDAGNWMIDAR